MRTFLEFLNHTFTLFLVFPLIITFGAYYTYKFRFAQIRGLKKSVQILLQKNTKDAGSISRLGALSSVLAGNFGTGNISGMAIALTVGGPGALVWMWIMAFFGAIIQYASCILGVLYRKQKANGEYVGGPMYYLRDGLQMNKLAKLFAIFTLFGAITVGNFAQINSMTLPLKSLGIPLLPLSFVIAIFVGIIIFGGVKRLAFFATLLVPFKALLYLGAGFTIILLNIDHVGDALTLMFKSAFNFTSVTGGFLGFGAFKAMSVGFDRGLFATDAGTGIVPILQSGARSEKAVFDGLATLIAPLMVMIVCTTTGLVLILTGAYLNPQLESTNMVSYAFQEGLHSPIGAYIVIIALILFAYTTILAWGYAGEKAFEFLVGEGKENYFRAFFVALVPLGVILHVHLIWTLADIAISLMLLINLIGISRLMPDVLEEHQSLRRMKV